MPVYTAIAALTHYDGCVVETIDGAATRRSRTGGLGGAMAAGVMDRVAERRLRAMVDARLFGEAREPVRIGRYRVLERLGVGSMGTVYGAMDDELGRKVALKLVHNHLLDDPSVGHARLLREARGLARLAHPNVVTVYEVGVHAGGIFLAMEYIEGSTLGAWLSATKRSTAAILEVMIAAGRGLAAAHAAGLVHRDIKPDNIIVDRRGRVRVVDFGLVRAIAPGHGRGLTPLTGAEVILGTPAYMSPEQICGDVPTAASDQYSFCMVLYEALFGERPIASQLGSARGGAGVTGRAGRIPGELGRVLARGLERRPEARYPTMAALLAELAGLAGRGRSRSSTVPLSIGRETLIRVLIGGLGLALALLVAIFWMAERRATKTVTETPTVVLWGDDGQRMVSGDRRGGVWVWDLEGARQLRGRCGESPIVALVTAEAGVIAAAARDGEVCLWRRHGETLELIDEGRWGSGSPVLALDRAGRWLVLGDGRGEVRAVEVEGSRQVGRWSAGAGIVGLRVTLGGEIVAVTTDGIRRFLLRAG